MPGFHYVVLQSRLENKTGFFQDPRRGRVVRKRFGVQSAQIECSERGIAESSDSFTHNSAIPVCASKPITKLRCVTMDIAPQTQSDTACCAAADIEAKIYHRFVVDDASEKYIRVFNVVWIWKGIPQICSDTRVVRVFCQIDRIISAPLSDSALRQHERRL